jgi:hypothetical protein
VNAYDELVERCAEIIPLSDEPATIVARAVLAEVLRTLETVTPDMEEAGLRTSYGLNTVEALAKDWSAMLCASPVTPPK